MSNLLFIRHAETDMSGTFCGHSDPPVNLRGRRQIAALIANLRMKPIEAVYSSDLQRAILTASAIAAAHDVPILINSQLREIYFGGWEGSTWDEINQRDSTFAQLWIEQHPNLAPLGGEPFADFQARVLTQIASLAEDTEYEDVAVVTHAGVMRVVLCSLCRLSEQEAWRRTQAYCCSFFFAHNTGLVEDHI
jgi:broad specificity phosphatase PhoE